MDDFLKTQQLRMHLKDFCIHTGNNILLHSLPYLTYYELRKVYLKICKKSKFEIKILENKFKD